MGLMEHQIKRPIDIGTCLEMARVYFHPFLFKVFAALDAHAELPNADLAFQCIENRSWFHGPKSHKGRMFYSNELLLSSKTGIGVVW